MTTRIGIVADLIEERWPSMDLVANSLVDRLETTAAHPALTVELLRPSLVNRGRRLGRYVNRFWDYPAWLLPHADRFDVFHVVDHSYAHLVHALPAERTVVTCHDIDAFMPLLEPRVVRSRLPRFVTRRVLSGMQRAAMVVCDSRATYDDVRRYSLIDDRKLAIAHVGVDEQFSPTPDAADAAILSLVGAPDPEALDLLHVGSTISRKRIDLLLDILAAVATVVPRVRLLKAGGALTAEQMDRAKALGVHGRITTLPFLDTALLSALYRRADVVLMTSDREGFGLPLAEALACGTAVIATDLPVLREIGGNAAEYCALANIAQWRDAILAVHHAGHSIGIEEQRAARVRRGATFRWDDYALAMREIYWKVVGTAALGATA